MAPAIAKQLHFNVARTFNKLFQEQARVLEVGLRQALHGLKRRGHFDLAANQAHANAAAARRAFEHDRVTDARRLALGLCQVG